MIAGSAKGHRIEAPPGPGTRPITDRVKESLFGFLDPVLEGARVLDLFAGSGAIAIEALSRGAQRAVLVERDRAAVGIIEANLVKTRLAPSADVREGEVLRVLGAGPPDGERFDLAFVDPPYELATEDVEVVLGALEPWLSPEALVVVRRRAADGAPALPATWEFVRERTYGDTLVLVVRGT